MFAMAISRMMLEVYKKHPDWLARLSWSKDS